MSNVFLNVGHLNICLNCDLYDYFDKYEKKDKEMNSLILSESGFSGIKDLQDKRRKFSCLFKFSIYCRWTLKKMSNDG